MWDPVEVNCGHMQSQATNVLQKHWKWLEDPIDGWVPFSFLVSATVVVPILTNYGGGHIDTWWRRFCWRT